MVVGGFQEWNLGSLVVAASLVFLASNGFRL